MVGTSGDAKLGCITAPRSLTGERVTSVAIGAGGFTAPALCRPRGVVERARTDEPRPVVAAAKDEVPTGRFCEYAKPEADIVTRACSAVAGRRSAWQSEHHAARSGITAWQLGHREYSATLGVSAAPRADLTAPAWLHRLVTRVMSGRAQSHGTGGFTFVLEAKDMSLPLRAVASSQVANLRAGQGRTIRIEAYIVMKDYPVEHNLEPDFHRADPGAARPLPRHLPLDALAASISGDHELQVRPPQRRARRVEHGLCEY